MSLPTLNDITAVDPVLSNILIGYKQEASRFIASQIFPVVPVDEKSGTYYLFDKKYWMTDEMQERVPGTEYMRAEFAASTTTYDTVQFALATPVADEIKNASQAPMDLETAAVEFLAQKSLIRKERAFSGTFMTTGVWGTSDTTTTDWDDFVSGDPVGAVILAVRTVSLATGISPNTIALGDVVHQAVVNHPDIIDRVKYVQMPTVEAVSSALASLMGVGKYIVGKAGYNTANIGQDFSAGAIIDDDALVCYVEPNPGIFKASAGYTFAWGGGGGDGVIINSRDDLNDANLIKTKEQWDQKYVASDLGYFFSDIV